MANDFSSVAFRTLEKLCFSVRVCLPFSMMWQKKNKNPCVPYAKLNFTAKRAKVPTGYGVKVRIHVYDE